MEYWEKLLPSLTSRRTDSPKDNNEEIELLCVSFSGQLVASCGDTGHRSSYGHVRCRTDMHRIWSERQKNELSVLSMTDWT